MLKDLNDHLESVQVLDVEYFYDHLLDLSNERKPKTNEDFRKSENFVARVPVSSTSWMFPNGSKVSNVFSKYFPVG